MSPPPRQVLFLELPEGYLSLALRHNCFWDLALVRWLARGRAALSDKLRLRAVVNSAVFNGLIFLVILANTGILASYHYGDHSHLRPSDREPVAACT